MVVGWLTQHKGKVVINDKVLAMKISAELGYNLIRKAYKTSDLTDSDYQLMNETVFQGQMTDSIMRTMTECKLSVPEPECKAYIWDLLTTPKKALSLPLYDYQILCRVFLLPLIDTHFALSMKHAAEFYDVVPNLILKLDRSRAESFLTSVCPAGSSEEDKGKLVRLLGEARERGELREARFYTDFLEDKINQIEVK